jgi:predicted nucleotidyltransferase
MYSTAQLHLDHIRALCENLGVERLELFGSAVREDFDQNSSDLDFLVTFTPALGGKSLAERYLALAEGLEGVLGKPVDLMTQSSLHNPFLRESIESEKRTVYAA